MRSVDRANAYFLWHTFSGLLISIATAAIMLSLPNRAAYADTFWHGSPIAPPLSWFVIPAGLFLIVPSVVIHVVLHFMRLGKYLIVVVFSLILVTWLFLASNLSLALVLTFLFSEVFVIIKLNEYWDEQDALRFRRESFVHQAR